MQIQINTDSNIEGREQFATHVREYYRAIAAGTPLVSVLTQPEGNLTEFRRGSARARLEQVFVFAARQYAFHLGEVQPQQMA